MTDLLPCPSCGGPNGVNDIVRFVAKLTRSEQYDIAFKIAENIGHRIVSDDLPAQPQEVSEPVSNMPEDTWGAFGYLVSRCASGLYKELVEKGRTDAQARNAVIHSFLDMASGEACRVARSEGRDPDESKWQKATKDAFDRAVARTSSLSRPQRGGE